MHSRELFSVLFYMALMGSVPTAYAGTLQEYKDLDFWCIASIKWHDAKGAAPYPPQQPERSFHYGHYCDAVRGLGDMYAAKDKQSFTFNYDFVIDNNGYVISNVPPDHHLLPLVYLLNGKAHYLAKNYSAAETNYLKASQLDPRYAPIYTALGYLYLDTKRKNDAAKAVKTGMALDPESKALRRMATDLGLKIEPLPVKQEPATAAVDLPPQVPMVVAAPTAPEPITASSARSESAVIGSPSNPWCRFCPDTPPASAGATPSTPGVIINAPR